MARQLFWVRRCACRTPRLAGEQLALHPAFCDACGQAVPGYAEQGGGRDGTSAPRYGEGSGYALHARAGRPGGGLPAPWAIGVDEISIRKGHNYRVIVSDLERARPIWVGGEGRKETDIDLFFKALGGKKSARIKLAAMDMWKPFRNSVIHNAPNARIIFDKFHIMRHLSKALDEVRRGEYKRLSGKDRSYIKGQRYTLLSRRENLSLDGRRALKKLLQANRRLNTAYILKEAFGKLWDYRTERGARAFFTRWKDSLKWQRLHPYQKFAGMIESHWDGIASYCHPENKVSLGLVEGVNNKIRVLQRRAYGYRDEEYLKLKIVAAFLPPLPRNAVFNTHESA